MSEPPPASGGVDLESLLGIRGAAWLGGITLIIAALFFAKWAVDRGFFSPFLRFILMLAAGTGALVWAEVSLRRGYDATANAVSAAGVVVLFLAFWAGHSLYGIIGVSAAFFGMATVSAVAAAVAIRYESHASAIVGLVGGLAAPWLMSTGRPNTLGLFAYLAVVVGGFLVVDRRRNWPALPVIALAGTLPLELAWYVRHMGPAGLMSGLAGVTALSAVWLWHREQTRDDRGETTHTAGIIGSLVPLGFAVLLCADARFASQWPVVVLYLAALDVVYVGLSVRDDAPELALAASAATGLSLTALGETHRAFGHAVWPVVAAALALAVAFNVLPRVVRAEVAAWTRTRRAHQSAAGLAAALGLLGFAAALVSGGRLPLGAFLAILTVLVAIATERSGDDEWPVVSTIGATMLAWLTSFWFSATATLATSGSLLVVPHLLAAVVAAAATWRDLTATDGAPRPIPHHVGTVIATAFAFAVLFGASSGRLSPAAPVVFGLLAIEFVLISVVVLRRRWSGLVPMAAVGVLALTLAWHARRQAPPPMSAVAAYLGFYVAFLAWPFVFARTVASWLRRAPAPWLTAALAGPAWFWILRDTWLRLFGSAWVAVVPLALAGITLAALVAVSRDFEVGIDDRGDRVRLDYLALFAAVALGFVAIAIPLQLSRQWITIGWALEAVGVWWLFGRLPHPGLKYFGLVLFTAVGARLLVNVAVLHYEPRGLPIVNWLLYTYGVPALACFAGVRWLGIAESVRGGHPPFDWVRADRRFMGPAVAMLGLLLVFWLINLEIADYFSAGRYIEVDFSRHLERDLTRSFAWGLYALMLLGLGIWRVHRGLRVVALGFLMLAVGKVFLYDLARLTGLFRILSFLAIGVLLILVSLLYQRFVQNREESE